MVQRNLLKCGIIGAIATIANAQSLLTPIDYSSSIELYYYFRTGNVAATISNEGISVEGSFSSNSELCSVLDGAEIVYSADGGSNVLLSSNCFSVYHLVNTSGSEITWDSCQEFPFYQSYCGSNSASNSISGLSSGSTTTLSTTATAQNTLSGSETLYLTTVTTTIDNIETLYTTYCPLSEITASHSQSPISDATTNIDALPVMTSVYTTTESGSLATYTTLIPVSGSATAGAAAQRTYVDNTDFYELLAASESAAESTSVSGSSTYVLTTVTSTIGNIATIYTTYCPLSDISKTSATSSVVSETPAQSAKNSVAVTPVVKTFSSVVTYSGEVSTMILLETETSGLTKAAPSLDASYTVVASSSSDRNVSTPAVTSYEGGASKLINSVSLVAIVAFVFGFLC